MAKTAKVDVDSLGKGLSRTKDPPPYTFQARCPATLPATRAVQVLHPITKQKMDVFVPVGVYPGGMFTVRVTNAAAPALTGYPVSCTATTSRARHTRQQLVQAQLHAQNREQLKAAQQWRLQ